MKILLNQLLETVKTQGSQLLRIEHEIFGNGKPGLMEDLKNLEVSLEKSLQSNIHLENTVGQLQETMEKLSLVIDEFPTTKKKVDDMFEFLKWLGLTLGGLLASYIFNQLFN